MRQCKSRINPADFNLRNMLGKRYVVGVSSERGAPLEVVGQAIMQGLDEGGVDIEDVACIVAIHVKAHDPAYSAFADVHEVPLVTCSVQALKDVADELSQKRLSESFVSEAWFTQKEISRLAAFFISGARRLIAPPFLFRILPDEPDVVVSICEIESVK